MSGWKDIRSKNQIGIVLWEADNRDVEHGLVLEIGQKFELIECCANWYRGRLLFSLDTVFGIIPTSHLKIVPNPYLKSDGDTISSPQAIKMFVVNALYAWLCSFPNSSRGFDVIYVSKIFQDLLSYNSNIGNVLTPAEITSIISLINDGNRLFGLENIPLMDGTVVDLNTTSLHELFKIHESSMNSDSQGGTTVGSGSLSEAQGTYVRPKLIYDQYHIFFSIKSMTVSIPDPSLWIFSIYDATIDCNITENYVINIRDPITVTNLQEREFNALFIDLTKSNILHTLYLFCKVYRIGNLLADKKNEHQLQYRRPFSIAYYPLTTLLRSDPNIEYNDKISFYHCDEEDIGNAEKTLLKDGQIGKFVPNQNSFFRISSVYYNGPLTLIRTEIPGLFTDETSIVGILGFSDTMCPEMVRNDFYLTLKQVSFDKFVLKGKPMNVEAAVTLWTSQGQLLPNCFEIGVGKDVYRQTEYKSSVLYHNNCPNWNETIKIIFPSDKLENIRILITFNHISANSGKSKGEKITMLSLSVIKLETLNHTIIISGESSYYMRKAEIQSGSSGKSGGGNVMDDARKLTQYLKERYNCSEPISDDSKISQTDILYVKTKLLSTMYTTNSDVYIIKEYETEKDKADRKDTFSHFAYADNLEVAKFLKPLFMNVAPNIESVDADGANIFYFQALIKVISVVNEKRFSKYDKILDDAVNCAYMPHLWARLIDYIDLALEKCPDQSKSVFYDAVKSFIENLCYLFKVIVKSWEQWKKETKEPISQILNKLTELFNNLFRLLSLSHTHLYALQIKLLNNFPFIFDDAPSIFSAKEFSSLVNNLLTSIPDYTQTSSNASKSSNTVPYKLKFLKKLVHSEHFADLEFRKSMFPIVIHKLHGLIKQESQLDVCTEAADILMSQLQYLDMDESNNEIKLLTNDLLITFLDANRSLRSKDKTVRSSSGNTLSVLLSLLNTMSKELFEEYFSTLEEENKIEFMVKLFDVFSNIFISKYISNSNFYLWIAVCKEMLKLTQFLSYAILKNFTDVKNVSDDLLTSFFNFSMEFINAPCLQKEGILSFNSRKVLEQSEDMRLEMGQTLYSIWDKLDSNIKINLSSFINSFVSCMLIEIKDLRELIFKIIYNMLSVYFDQRGNMDYIQNKIVGYIDSDFQNHYKYGRISAHFSTYMKLLFDKCENKTLSCAGLKSTKELTETINTLTYYSPSAEYSSCIVLQALKTYYMIEFYTQISHHEMIERNLMRLVHFNEELGSFNEGGLCYLALAEKYKWDFDSSLPELEGFDKSTPGNRKEEFLWTAIGLLERGLNLESALSLCRLLVPLYDIQNSDYIKLSEVYTKMADLTRKIAIGESSMDTYYRINFIGLKFPPCIQNKSFIFHMGSCTSLGTAMQFVQKNFPSATIPVTSAHNLDLAKKDVQIITIQAYNPSPSDPQTYEKYYQISEPISRFYKNANVTTFIGNSTSEVKKEVGGVMIPVPQFIRTTCKTGFLLPTTIMMSPIISEDKIIITQLEQTLNIVLGHTNELNDLCRNLQYNSTLQKNIQMKLSGNLNAFVNGGLAVVVPKFFNNTYLLEYPGDSNTLETLRNSFKTFMETNAHALETLNETLDDTMIGFITNLVESYQTTRDELQRMASVESPDLGYLLALYSVGSNSASGFSTVKYSSTNQLAASNSDSISTTGSRRDTVTSYEQQGGSLSYSTIKKAKIRSTTKLQQEEPRSRSASVKGVEKLTPTTSSERSEATPPLSADRFKKKYGLFQKKK